MSNFHLINFITYYEVITNAHANETIFRNYLPDYLRTLWPRK